MTQKGGLRAQWSCPSREEWSDWCDHTRAGVSCSADDALSRTLAEAKSAEVVEWWLSVQEAKRNAV